jgi:ankyrin repeat protein
LACINGQFEVVKYLLSVGLDSNATDSSQNLPVHYAAAFGYLEILHLLIHFGGADPNKINLWRSTACSIANMKGHLSLVKYLLDLPDCIDVNFKDQDGLSMLHHTVLETVTSTSEINQNMKQIKLLLNMNADVNSINLEGDTVMHSLVSITTYCNYYPKEWKPYYVDDEAKYAGYRATATLKSTDEDDMTGVNYHLDVGRMLLEKGADINVLNNHGETCLSVAMKAENHYLVAFLIENGARYWSDADRDGNNFFHYFGKLAATIDHLQPHRPVDETQKERFIQAADKVWKSVNKSKPDMEKLNETVSWIF